MRHIRQKGRAIRVSRAINATNKRPTVGVHYSSRRRICSHVKRVAKAAPTALRAVTLKLSFRKIHEHPRMA